MRCLATRAAIVGSLLFLIVWFVSALAGYPLSTAAVGLTGFGLLLGMALSYATGTFQTLAAISPPSQVIPSRR